jgi:hypothetical protein
MTIAENGAVGIGTETPGYKLHVAGDIYANGGWARVSGDQGFFCESWGGGWNMTDSSYMRCYGGKEVYTSNFFYTDSGYKVGGTVVVDSSRNLTNIGSINAGSLKLNGYTQPKVISSANFSGQTGFYTNNWDLNNYANTEFRSVEVRLIIDRVGTNGGAVTFAFGDNGGTYCAPQEATTFNQGKKQLVKLYSHIHS